MHLSRTEECGVHSENRRSAPQGGDDQSGKRSWHCEESHVDTKQQHVNNRHGRGESNCNHKLKPRIETLITLNQKTTLVGVCVCFSDMVEGIPGNSSAVRHTGANIEDLLLRDVCCLLMEYLRMQARPRTSRVFCYASTVLSWHMVRANTGRSTSPSTPN